MYKYNKFMEKFWLVVAIAGFFFAAYKIGQTSFTQAGIYLVLPCVAAALSYLRYYTRKRFQQNPDNDEE